MLSEFVVNNSWQSEYSWKNIDNKVTEFLKSGNKPDIVKSYLHVVFSIYRELRI